MSDFLYLGNIFTPVKTLKGLNFDEISRKITRDFLFDKKLVGYSYHAFYEEAEKVGAKEFDVFECNGKNYLPCSNYLFKYNG